MRRATLSALVLLLLAPFSTAWSAPRTHAGVRVRALKKAQIHKRSVPPGFLGVMADGPLLDPARALDPEFKTMVQSGVESVRFVADWAELQPYPNLDAVPSSDRGRFTLVDGIPTDFATTDRLVRAAAVRGMRSLPVVLFCPLWARKDPSRSFSPPADPVAYGRFVGVLARRYGPGGSFWKTPRLPYRPVRDWQIWNEPAGGDVNHPDPATSNWDDPEPFPQRYVAMLRSARAQVKAADPKGRIILAGNYGLSWLATDAIYRAHGRGAFDAVALNIFTRRVADAIEIVRRNRAVMNRNGDRRLPIMITESSWPSSLGMVHGAAQRDYEVSKIGQAARVKSAIKGFAAVSRSLKIERFFWFTWAGYDYARENVFLFAGLRVTPLSIPGAGYRAKPAQAAYAAAALKLEGCRKLNYALRCGR